jgi:hypothetical protein
MSEVYKRPLARMMAQDFGGLMAPRGPLARLRGQAEKVAVALRYALF